MLTPLRLKSSEMIDLLRLDGEESFLVSMLNVCKFQHLISCNSLFRRISLVGSARASCDNVLQIDHVFFELIHVDIGHLIERFTNEFLWISINLVYLFVMSRKKEAKEEKS